MIDGWYMIWKVLNSGINKNKYIYHPKYENCMSKVQKFWDWKKSFFKIGLTVWKKIV